MPLRVASLALEIGDLASLMMLRRSNALPISAAPLTKGERGLGGYWAHSS
jgi:hypothetical protein